MSLSGYRHGQPAWRIPLNETIFQMVKRLDAMMIGVSDMTLHQHGASSRRVDVSDCGLLDDNMLDDSNIDMNATCCLAAAPPTWRAAAWPGRRGPARGRRGGRGQIARRWRRRNAFGVAEQLLITGVLSLHSFRTISLSPPRRADEAAGAGLDSRG